MSDNQFFILVVSVVLVWLVVIAVIFGMLT